MLIWADLPVSKSHLYCNKKESESVRALWLLQAITQHEQEQHPVPPELPVEGAELVALVL